MKLNAIVFAAIVFSLCLAFGVHAQNTTVNVQNCTPPQVKPTPATELPPIPSWHPALDWLSPQSQAVLNRTMANAGAGPVYPNLNNSACYSEFLQFRNKSNARLAQNYKKLYIPYTVKNDTIDGVNVTWVTTPNTTANDLVIIYLHPGRFMYGNSYVSAPGVIPIADMSHIKAVSVDYRLVPEYPYPAALEDIKKVYNWLLKNGYRNENIAFYGDSAGGNLAIATVLMLKDEGSPLPSAVAIASPTLDLSKVSDSFYTLNYVDPVNSFSGNDRAYSVYVGKENVTNPYISPMYGNFSGFPPLYIQVGEREVYLSGCAQTALKAYHARVPVVFNVWDAMWHVFSTIDPQLPESRQANKDAADFIAKYLEVNADNVLITNGPRNETLTEQENLITMKQAYADFQNGNISAVLDAFTQDGEYINPGGSEIPLSGSYSGKDKIGWFLRNLSTFAQFTQFKPQEYIAKGDKVVSSGFEQGISRLSGLEFSSDWAAIATFSNGKISRIQFFEDTASIAAANPQNRTNRTI